MPGINLFTQQSGISQDQAQRVLTLAETLVTALPQLSFRTTRSSSESIAVLSENPSYLVLDCKHGDWQVYLEMQGASGLPEGFSALLDELSAPDSSTRDLTQAWSRHLAQYTGSFFFVAINPGTRIMVFANDALARLPVYISRDGGRLNLGRDISLIRGAADKLTANPLYMALFQMLTFVPGRGTPHAEIDTLKGGTLAVYDWALDDLKLVSQPGLRFAEADQRGSPQTRLPELIDLFDASVQSCQSDLPTVLSLSGGFDSRCVAASLLRQKIPFDSYTYLDADRAATDEVLIARQLAAAAGFPHRVLELGVSERSEHQTLMQLKGSLNYLSAAFFVQHLNEILGFYPQGMLLFTGDGGDKTLRDLHPDRPLASARQWLDYFYEFEAIFDPQTCAQLFGVTPREIDDYLLDLIAAYPQTDYSEKYASYILTEQAARWAFEGEDRNRYFCRAETPFYDYRFYRLARQIPNAWKKDYAIYSSFLSALSPELSRVRYANRKWSPARMKNPWYRMMVAQTRKLRRVVAQRQTMKARETSFATKSWMSLRILEQLKDEALKGQMPGFTRINNAQYLDSLTKIQMGTLYTVTSFLTGSA